MQFALREEDFKILEDVDHGGALHQLQVPRHKKRATQVRDDFKARKLTPEIAEVIQELINANRRILADAEFDITGMAHPLFMRPNPRELRVGGPLHEFALGLMASEFTGLEASREEVGRPLASDGRSPVHHLPSASLHVRH